MKNSLVSVVITTKNNEKTIEPLLKSLVRQSYQKVEVIVVDNNSTDRTVSIAKKYADKILNKGPERSAQRNYGIKHSKGTFLLILDSDMVLTKDVVRDCVDEIKENGGVVIPEKSIGKNYWAKVKAFERELNEGEVFFEAARFFPKKIVKQFSGYDEKLTGPEDWDLPKRISKKYKIVRTGSYIIHNEGRHTLISLLKKKYYYGLSAHKFLKKHKIPVISSTTVYFMRPAFYRHWLKLVINPKLTLGLLIMLIAETIGGGLGYLVGRFKNE